MDKTNIFAKVYGGSASMNDFALAIIHFISVPLTAFGVYAAWGEYMDALSMPQGIRWAFSIIIALAVQVVVFAKEGGVARQLVWWAFPAAGAVFMFIVDASILSGAIWTNHQISQRGRIYIVNRMVEDPIYQENDSISISRDAALAPILSQYRADSMAIVQQLAQAKKANAAAEKAVRVKIGPNDYRNPNDALKKANDVQSSSPSWAAGIRQNVKAAQAAAAAERLAADAKAEQLAAEKLAALSEDRKAKEAPIFSSWAMRSEQHKIKEEARMTRKGEGKALLMDAGKWIVILTAFGSILLRISHEIYRRVSGLELVGEVHDPERSGSRIRQEISKAIDARKKVTADRLAASTSEYIQSASAKGAYRLPPSRYILGFFLISILAFSVSQTSFFSFSEQQEMSIVPAPWNFVLLFLSLVASGSFFWHERNAGKTINIQDKRGQVKVNLSDVVQDELEEKNDLSSLSKTGKDNLSENSQEIKDNKPETVVRQQSQLSEDNLDNDDTIEISTPHQIALAKDRCRKYYERQFTSATTAGQESNRKKYKAEKKALARIGIKATPTGTKISRNVKIEGKPERVTYNRIEFSE